MNPKQVADMFVDAGWLNAEEGHALGQEAATTGKPIETVMVEHDIVTEDDIDSPSDTRSIQDTLALLYDIVDLDAFYEYVEKA